MLNIFPPFTGTYVFITARKRSLREGNVFSISVCPQGQGQGPGPPRSRSKSRSRGGQVKVLGPPWSRSGWTPLVKVLVKVWGAPLVKVQVKVWGTPPGQDPGQGRGPHRSRSGSRSRRPPVKVQKCGERGRSHRRSRRRTVLF